MSEAYKDGQYLHENDQSARGDAVRKQFGSLIDPSLSTASSSQARSITNAAAAADKSVYGSGSRHWTVTKIFSAVTAGLAIGAIGAGAYYELRNASSRATNLENGGTSSSGITIKPNDIDHSSSAINNPSFNAKNALDTQHHTVTSPLPIAATTSSIEMTVDSPYEVTFSLPQGTKIVCPLSDMSVSLMYLNGDLQNPAIVRMLGSQNGLTYQITFDITGKNVQLSPELQKLAQTPKTPDPQSNYGSIMDSASTTLPSGTPLFTTGSDENIDMWLAQAVQNGTSVPTPTTLALNFLKNSSGQYVGA